MNALKSVARTQRVKEDGPRTERNKRFLVVVDP